MCTHTHTQCHLWFSRDEVIERQVFIILWFSSRGTPLTKTKLLIHWWVWQGKQHWVLSGTHTQTHTHTHKQYIHTHALTHTNTHTHIHTYISSTHTLVLHQNLSAGDCGWALAVPSPSSLSSFVNEEWRTENLS